MQTLEARYVRGCANSKRSRIKAAHEYLKKGIPSDFIAAGDFFEAIMIVLGIETATTICSVGIANEERVLAETWFGIKNIHDRVLRDGIAYLTEQIKAPLNQIEAIAVSAGPGSFTGLRIGMAVAKGLAFAQQKPLIAIGTLAAQAFAAQAFARKKDELIVPLIRSRKGEVYSAKFRSSDELPIQITSEQVKEIADVSAWLHEPAIICGDGVAMLRAEGALQSLQHCFIVPEGSVRLSGGMIARLGQLKLARGETTTAEALTPLYVQEFETGATRKI